MTSKKNEKIIIVFGFLIIIIYLCRYLDLNNIIKNSLLLSEDFTNPFKPNKIFRYNNKIYLLDSRNILKKNENPKVFNNFKEYQDFIIKLEKEFNIELNNKINKDSDIKDLELKDNKSNNYGLEPYDKTNKCNKLASKCSYSYRDPYFETIFDNNEREIKDMECKMNFISKQQCRDIENIAKNERELTKKCEKLNSEGKEKTLDCKKLDFYKHNGGLLKEICYKIEKKKEFDDYKNLCLLEDQFRENMLEFEI
jgi:hypothetical protein